MVASRREIKTETFTITIRGCKFGEMFSASVNAKNSDMYTGRVNNRTDDELIEFSKKKLDFNYNSVRDALNLTSKLEKIENAIIHN